MASAEVRHVMDRAEMNDVILTPQTFATECGHCGDQAQCRVVVQTESPDETTYLLVCPCPRGLGSAVVFSRNHDGLFGQFPPPVKFKADQKWPDEPRRMYDEAAKAHAAGAYTAAAMACRKLISVVAVTHGAKDGDTFNTHIDHIIATFFNSDRYKPKINAMKKIGTDANHKIEFVTEEQSATALTTGREMLNTIFLLGA